MQPGWTMPLRNGLIRTAEVLRICATDDVIGVREFEEGTDVHWRRAEPFKKACLNFWSVLLGGRRIRVRIFQTKEPLGSFTENLRFHRMLWACQLRKAHDGILKLPFFVQTLSPVWPVSFIGFKWSERLFGAAPGWCTAAPPCDFPDS